MTRRHLVIVSTLLLIALIGIGVYALMPPKPDGTPENFEFSPKQPDVLERCRRWLHESFGW